METPFHRNRRSLPDLITFQQHLERAVIGMRVSPDSGTMTGRPSRLHSLSTNHRDAIRQLSPTGLRVANVRRTWGCLPFGGLRIVAVAVSLPNGSVLLVDQVLDPILLRRSTPRCLRLGFCIVGA